ncbi:MAG: hypothetical protein R3D03_04760 [Geminicoccaceae bacterium]
MPEQIARADQTIPLKANIFREILFKPSTADEPKTDECNRQEIHAKLFDAIGVTEKEIGGTQQARMV